MTTNYFQIIICVCIFYLVVFFSFLFFRLLILFVDSFPYQFLPSREGYVPVYIRMGDTPLNEINPELAIAFHEVAVNGRQLKSNDEVSHKLCDSLSVIKTNHKTQCNSLKKYKFLSLFFPLFLLLYFFFAVR